MTFPSGTKTNVHALTARFVLVVAANFFEGNATEMQAAARKGRYLGNGYGYGCVYDGERWRL